MQLGYCLIWWSCDKFFVDLFAYLPHWFFFSEEINFDFPFVIKKASGILHRVFNTFTTLLREKFVFNEWLNRKIIILSCSVFYGLFLELKFPTDIQQCSGNPNKRKFKSTSKWPRFIDTNRIKYNTCLQKETIWLVKIDKYYVPWLLCGKLKWHVFLTCL